MAGTTRLELATSAVTGAVIRWATQNQQVRQAVVGNRWLRWAGLARFYSTVCATPRAPQGQIPRTKLAAFLSACSSKRKRFAPVEVGFRVPSTHARRSWRGNIVDRYIMWN